MALRYISTGEKWNGEPINNAIFPLTIANTKAANADEIFASLGLERIPEPEIVPAPVTVADIEAETGRRITSRFPLYAQANAQARATELLEILTVPPVREWTEAEATEATWLRMARAWIAEVRAAGKVLEAELPAGYRTSETWPADFETWAAARIASQSAQE